MSIKVNINKNLKGFNLNVNFETTGKRVGILGASGCGKSMTLKCIAGIEKPQSGQVMVGNRILFDSQRHINLPPQKRKVGYMFQQYALFPHMTVAENIGIGVYKDEKSKARIIEEAIKRFRLEGLEKRQPMELSGGQQQRVALARIFAYEPEVILLDEPFSALDQFLKDKLAEELLASLEDFKGEIIIVSHNRDEIYTLCDEMIIMNQGETLLRGDTKEIFKSPQRVEAAKFTGCKNISPIKRLSSHELFAEDWQVRLKIQEEISESIRYVGIRAHDMKVCEGTEVENVLEVELIKQLECPFEMQYVLRNSKAPEAKVIWFQVPKIKNLEQTKFKIQLPAQALMLLE